ncbi:MAG: hypothetical protein HQ481_07475 [Alphaproteobacteria bacterium]|nr:hypothetical protein [Alphaproteobacteria bacterium]
MKYLLFNLVVGAALAWLVIADRPVTEVADAPVVDAPIIDVAAADAARAMVSAPAPSQANEGLPLLPEPAEPRFVAPPPLPRDAPTPAAGGPLVPDPGAVPTPQAVAAPGGERSVEREALMSSAERARSLRALARDMETLFLKTME